jgi:hypothetical protein
MNKADYKYVEFTVQETSGDFSGRLMILESGLVDMPEKITGSPLRSTWIYNSPKMDEDRRPMGDFIGDFYMDFDSGDLSTARTDVCMVLDLLERTYRIDLNVLQMGFSGKKGFWLIIPYEVIFGDVIVSGDDLIFLYRGFGEFLRPNAPTLDLAIYGRRRMWKLTNSVHPGSGLFRVELRPDELRIMDIEKIKELAKNPRSLPRGPVRHSILLRNQIQMIGEQRIKVILRKEYKEGKDFKEATPEERIPRRFRRTYSPPGRNPAICELVGVLQRAGVSYDDCCQIVLAFNRVYCSPSKSEDEALQPVEYYYNKK